MIRLALLIAVGCTLVAAGTASSSRALLPGFDFTSYGDSAGGTVLGGTIPGRYAPAQGGTSYVYLPPGYTIERRYPVVYLLHGMPGDPRIYVRAAHLARAAAQLIAAGAPPFIAVAPYAGPATHRGSAEWAGQWESYLVKNVVPWTDAHLPTVRSAAGRTLAGLSAGGFGALDIGLRHLGMFGTLESWSGYFTPLPDGPFVHATPHVLAGHDPALLVLRKAAALRRSRIRFELSTGVAHGGISPAMTTSFAEELRTLRLPYSFWEVPGSVDGTDYGDQMQHGLAYAFGRG
jgi:enterochelin esterase-like enzyme